MKMKNTQHWNVMWNCFPVGQAYGVSLMPHVKYEGYSLSFSAFLADLNELGNVEQLALAEEGKKCGKEACFSDSLLLASPGGKNSRGMRKLSDF